MKDKHLHPKRRWQAAQRSRYRSSHPHQKFGVRLCKVLRTSNKDWSGLWLGRLLRSRFLT